MEFVLKIKNDVWKLLFQKNLVIVRKSRIILVFSGLTSEHIYFAHVWSVCFFGAIITTFPSYKNHSAVGEPIAIVNAS